MDNQHLPYEVAEFQEIWALILVLPLLYWANHFLGSAFVSLQIDGWSFLPLAYIYFSNFSVRKKKKPDRTKEPQLCSAQMSRSCMFNSKRSKRTMYINNIWLPNNILQSIKDENIENILEEFSLGRQLNQDAMMMYVTRIYYLLLCETIRPSSLVPWIWQWQYLI